jgi:phage anti-repressor protein
MIPLVVAQIDSHQKSVFHYQVLNNHQSNISLISMQEKVKLLRKYFVIKIKV